MKRREGARNRERERETKTKARGESDFDRICKPIRLAWICELSLRRGRATFREPCWKNLDFVFLFFLLALQAYCASNAGERVDMDLISQRISQILEKNAMGCARKEENCFFLFNLSSITGVRLRDLHLL